MIYYINKFDYKDFEDAYLTETNVTFKIPGSNNWWIMNNLSLSGKMKQFG